MKPLAQKTDSSVDMPCSHLNCFAARCLSNASFYNPICWFIGGIHYHFCCSTHPDKLLPPADEIPLTFNEMKNPNPNQDCTENTQKRFGDVLTKHKLCQKKLNKQKTVSFSTVKQQQRLIQFQKLQQQLNCQLNNCYYCCR